MATRNIKCIAHDLLPLSGAISELGSIISELLNNIQAHAVFDNPALEQYFLECCHASQNLTVTARLMKGYVDMINEEADREGVTKE